MANEVSKFTLKDVTYNIKDSTARTAIANLPSPMVFKGTLGESGTITELPTASNSTIGYTYKVITDGAYSSITAKVGDIFICSDAPAWVLVPSGDEPSGTVTNIATGEGLVGGPITTSGTISLASSGVTAGTYQGLTVDAYGRVIAAEDKGYDAGKQETLVSGTNIKTINGESILGSGNITTLVADTAMSDTSTNAVQNKVIKAYVDEAILGAMNASY